MTLPYIDLRVGSCIDRLREMPEKCVQTCVTSPPYFGLRNYHGGDKEIGKEKTPAEFVASLVAVFREVRRVLKDDGTVWLNLGDSYARTGGTDRQVSSTAKAGNTRRTMQQIDDRTQKAPEGMKDKQLLGIPWRVAFALQDDGWILRQDIIWSKPNPMPESVRDRCTKAHEYIFLLSKKPKYYFDSEAIRNPPSPALLKQVAEGYGGEDTKDFEESGAQSASGTKSRIIDGARKKVDRMRGHDRTHDGFKGKWDQLTRAEQMALGSNKRSVWTCATKPFKGAHFATFPPDLIEPCILAGSRPGDRVLDPFLGSGTTGVVATKHGRSITGIDLNPEYLAMASDRIYKPIIGDFEV